MNLLSLIIMALYAILPSSPIQSLMADVSIEGDVLGWLNWFIPFDIASKCTLAWLACVVAYYLYILVRKIIMQYIIGKLIG